MAGEEWRRRRAGDTQLAQALALYRELGDTARMGAIAGRIWPTWRANRATMRARRRCLPRALALQQQAGETQALAWHLHGWGELALLQGTMRQRARLEQSVALFRRQGNERVLALSLYNLGYVAQHLGDRAHGGVSAREPAAHLAAATAYFWRQASRAWRRSRDAGAAGARGAAVRGGGGVPDEDQSFACWPTGGKSSATRPRCGRSWTTQRGGHAGRRGRR